MPNEAALRERTRASGSAVNVRNAVDVAGRLGRLALPQLADQPVLRADLVRCHEQEGQQRVLATTTELDRRAVLEYLKWAEDPELDRGLLIAHRGSERTNAISCVWSSTMRGATSF